MLALRKIVRFIPVSLLAFVGGCAWKVTPPTKVMDPVSVQLTEYGRHTRLALPADDGRSFVEFGFGEWNYYGLEKRGNWEGIRAISGLGEGALSRRTLPAGADGRFDPGVAAGGHSASIVVEAEKVKTLRDKLEARWRQNQGDVVVRSWDGVPVSRDPASYHLFNNSNRATARWLEELDCKVRGFPLGGDFRVKSPFPDL